MLPLACGWRRHSHRFSLGARTRQSHTGENMRIEENVPFKTLTTFKVGGVVRYVLTLESASGAVSAVQFAQEKKLPLIPLGGGSNILGRDGIFNAVMVRVGMDDITTDTAHAGRAIVSAGAVWDDVVRFAVEHDWWGIENLSDIPGTMGGAVVQNIGAYGAVLSDVLESVSAFDTVENEIVQFTRKQCAFGYRTSIFKQNSDRYIILSATLALSTVATPAVTYKDLQSVFGDRKDVSLAEIRKVVQEVRAQKFPPLTDFGTAGSFFLNPIVDEASAARLTQAHPSMPVFTLPEGGIKIPLGWFFEHTLKLRGYQEGNVEAWRNQALVLVAHDGATAEEVKVFAEKIIQRADNELQIKITAEVRLL